MSNIWLLAAFFGLVSHREAGKTQGATQGNWGSATIYYYHISTYGVPEGRARGGSLLSLHAFLWRRRRLSETRRSIGDQGSIENKANDKLHLHS